MATAAQTKHERLRAAISGDETDRSPIALWQHFPVRDQTVNGLVDATLRFHRTWDWDLIKFTPTGTYAAADWGSETAWLPNDHGTRTILRHGVTRAEDWPRLANLDVRQGEHGLANEALRIVADALRGQVPLVQTVFSPLTTARKLAGERVFADLRMNPELLHEGLRIITHVTAQFAKDALTAGANGIFFATQNASFRVLTCAEYAEFGQPYDLEILEAVANAHYRILHVHGHDTQLQTLLRYPVNVLNWHDRADSPTLAAASQKFPGLLSGGIDEWETLRHGSPEQVAAQIADAVDQVEGRRLLLSPGCVMPQDVPPANLRAAREAVARTAVRV